MSELPQQVLATDLAVHLIRVLREKHGPLMFHQSGGEPFYMSKSQFEYWKHTQLTLDVVPGRGGMFSLDNGEGVRFLIRSRVFENEEIRDLRAAGRI
jgi:uncharacterized protein (DUF779 family)